MAQGSIKHLPHIIGLFSTCLWIFGFILFQDNAYPFIARLLIILGFFIFGFAGVIIIKSKSCSFGVFEINGLVSQFYGSLFVLSGWGLSIVFIFRFFFL